MNISRKNLFSTLCAMLFLASPILTGQDVTGTFSDVVTSGGTLGGVGTATESRLSGGGAAFSQRLLVGIAGNSAPSAFYGSRPTTNEANATIVGGGMVTTSLLYSIADINGGGFRGGRYSAADPNLYIMGGWLPGGAAVRAGIKFSTSPAAAVAPYANCPTQMEINPDGQTIFFGTDQGTLPALGEVKVGGGIVRAGNYFRSDGTGTRVSFISTGSNSNLQIGHQTTDSNARIFNSGGGIAVCLDLNNLGVGTFVVAGSPPQSAIATQVAMGGGQIISGGGMFAAGTTSRPNLPHVSLQSVGNIGYVDSALNQSVLTQLQLRSNGTLINSGSSFCAVSGTAPTDVPLGEVRMGGGRVMVGGTLSAKEIKVTTTGADYVFENHYKLRPLAEVESFIAEHKHLPEMMSAKAMQVDGMPVSEVVTKQLAKIEELTLYAIAQKKETEAARAESVAARTEALATRAELNDLKSRMERLEKALANQ